MLKKEYLLVILPLLMVSEIAWSAPEQSTMQTKASATENYLSDTAITAKVKSELIADDLVKNISISVTTNKGVVTLRGNVDKVAQKKKALKITSHVSGVKLVRDELTVNTTNHS